MKILFLCTGNYYRSRFAEHFFNFYATVQKIDCVAESRALADNLDCLGFDGPISTEAIKQLGLAGVTLSGPFRFPQSLVSDEISRYDLIICMDKKEHKPMVSRRKDLCNEPVMYWKIKDLRDEPASRSLLKCRKEIIRLIHKIKKKAKAVE